MGYYHSIINEPIKQYARDKGVSLREIAEEAGIAYSTLMTRLRTEFVPEQYEVVKDYIDRAARRKALVPPKPQQRRVHKGGF